MLNQDLKNNEAYCITLLSLKILLLLVLLVTAKNIFIIILNVSLCFLHFHNVMNVLIQLYMYIGFRFGVC